MDKKEIENRIRELQNRLDRLPTVIETIDCPQCPFYNTAECIQHHENAECEEAVAELRGEI